MLFLFQEDCKQPEGYTVDLLNIRMIQTLYTSNTYLVEVLLQGNDELSMDDNIVIFQCVYEFIENSNRFL
jgi:hypothetical protein